MYEVVGNLSRSGEIGKSRPSDDATHVENRAAIRPPGTPRNGKIRGIQRENPEFCGFLARPFGFLFASPVRGGCVDLVTLSALGVGC